MKLWLLDADVIIDLIRLEIFDKLTALHEINAASTVIDEVKYCIRDGVKVPTPFRAKYVDTGTVREVSAEPEELAEALNRIPENQRSVIHGGELESMAVLVRRDDLVFCSCDAATIRTLPFLDLSERGISVERLLKTSGLTQSSFEDRHTEAYFKSNLDIGKKSKLGLLSTSSVVALRHNTEGHRRTEYVWRLSSSAVCRGAPRGVPLPCSHAPDHTRYVSSTPSMLIADRGECRCRLVVRKHDFITYRQHCAVRRIGPGHFRARSALPENTTGPVILH